MLGGVEGEWWRRREKQAQRWALWKMNTLFSLPQPLERTEEVSLRFFRGC